MSHEKIEISDVTRENIVNKLIEPYYMDMIKTTIGGKKLWRTLGISLETSSKLMVALGGIFSFSAGFYHDDTLSFVSGSISCMSLALLQVASFSYKENKKQGEELNILLKKLNLDTIPSMIRSEDQTTVVASSRYLSPPRPPPSFPLTHHPRFSFSYPEPNIQRSNSFTRDPVNQAQVNQEQIIQKLNELNQQELRLNEIRIHQQNEYELQQREYELQQKEYNDFLNSTTSVREELLKVQKELDVKQSKLYEREERIKEKEGELNLQNNM